MRQFSSFFSKKFVRTYFFQKNNKKKKRPSPFLLSIVIIYKNSLLFLCKSTKEKYFRKS